MKQDELVNQFEEEFKAMKKELGIKPSLEDYDNIFFLRDLVMKEGFVSKHLSRWTCMRIMETYMSWVNYLHNIMNPNPSYLIGMNESQAFRDKEIKGIGDLIGEIMILVSKNMLVGITKDRVNEKEFLDDSVTFWNETLAPKLKIILAKVNNKWAKDAKLAEEKKPI